MNVLLTGAAGFIGSHTAESLLADGHRVVGVDNFDPFYDRSAKERNLAGPRGSKLFGFVEADICDVGAMESLFAAQGPFDAIIHLAAKAGVRPSIADPGGYERTNIAGTISLLQQAVGRHQAGRTPRFIFASSSSVYGNNPKVPFSESDNVDGPISPYAATKKAGELICHTYYHLYKLPVFCLRFFTVYGPRQRPDLAIRKFALSILQGKPIELFGDGNTSRDYTYIDDIVHGIRRSVERCEGYQVINLGGEHPVTLTQMVDAVALACGKEASVRRLPMQPGDVERTFANIQKARSLLGYNPSTPFEQGVAKFVQWLRRQDA